MYILSTWRFLSIVYVCDVWYRHVCVPPLFPSIVSIAFVKENNGTPQRFLPPFTAFLFQVFLTFHLGSHSFHAKYMLLSTEPRISIRRVGVSATPAPSPDRDEAVSLPLTAAAWSYIAPLAVGTLCRTRVLHLSHVLCAYACFIMSQLSMSLIKR